MRIPFLSARRAAPGPQGRPDHAALVRDLVAALGEQHVLHAPEDLIGFEYDATIDRRTPDAVVFPETTAEVAAAVIIANAYGVPVVPRGSGTGLAGGTVPVRGGVVVALTRMNRILELDPRDRIAVVQPGVINLALQDACAPLGLLYAPDPSSQRICTIGGNVATNSGGPHTLAHGSTVNHVLGLEVVLPDGRVTWLGGRQLDAPGVDLRGLFVGSEGTLGIVTQICVRLQRQPEAVRTMLAIFDSVAAASEAVSAIIRGGVIPVALEMLDNEIIKAVEPRLHVGYPLDAGAVLLIEVEGLRESVLADAERVVAACEAQGAREVRTAESEVERARLWEGRKGGIGAIGALSPNFYILDGVVPRTRLPAVMAEVLRLSDAAGFRCANIFHAGDGNLHPNIMFDELVPGATQRVLDLGGEIMRLCVDNGGSITGEHGVGLEKRSYMEWIFSPQDLDAMGKLRVAFGTGDIFNPCKVLPTGHGCGQAHEAEIRQHLATPGVYV
jgi:glycolate oxidase